MAFKPGRAVILSAGLAGMDAKGGQVAMTKELEWLPIDTATERDLPYVTERFVRSANLRVKNLRREIVPSKIAWLLCHLSKC